MTQITQERVIERKSSSNLHVYWLNNNTHMRKVKPVKPSKNKSQRKHYHWGAVIQVISTAQTELQIVLIPFSQEERLY